MAAWRDGLVAQGDSPSGVNAMLAAVHVYQEFCGMMQNKGKTLKCRPCVFCDAERELNRGEYFRFLNVAPEL